MATNNAAEMIPRIALKGTLGVSGPLNSDYDALINKPQINGNELVGNKTNAELGIPTELADLTADADHRTVSDTEKETWNAKSDFSGSYNDLNDVPEDLVEDAEYVHTDNNYTSAEKTKLGDIEFGAEVNIQADWNETDTSSDAYIQNKPTIPAAQVNSDWNASSGVAEILHKPILGTAAAKDYTGSVLENSTDLVESGAVKTAIDNAISSVYKPAGNKACAELVSALLIAANLGNVYNMTDDGVTTADFVEGAGKAIEAGDNVVIVDIGSSVYKFDLLSGMVDLSNYVQKSSTSGLIKNDGTIDQTAYAKQNEMSVSTNGDQTTIQLKNETTATVINAHQDISGKANKSEMTVTPGTGSDADKTTIQLKSGTDATVLTQHQDISGKVDKEQGKGLSTNDYTTAEKEKLAAISTEANKVTASETNGNIQIDGTETTVYDDTELQGAVSDLEDDVEEIQGEITTETATIEGNPLNFSTKSAQNAKSTILSVEPIQDLHGYDKPWVGGAGKNLFDISLVNTSNFNISNLTISNKVTDNKTYFSFQIQKFKNGSLVSTVLTRDIDSIRERAIDFTLSGDDYDSIRLKHNGSSVDIEIALIPFTKSGSFAISFNVLGANPNSVDGLKLSNIQIETGSQATSYEPYENICPISGRTEIGILGCGKNLLDDSVVDLYQATSDPTVERYGYTPFKLEKGSYIFTYQTSDPNYLLYFTNTDTWEYTELSPTGTTINLSKDTNIFIRSSLNSASSEATFRNIFTNPMLRLASDTDSTFSPYTKSNDLTISLGQTVYGGTLDVENGVLVVDKVCETFDGSDSNGWNRFATYGTSTRFDNGNVTPKNSHMISNYLSVGTIGTNDLECINIHTQGHRLLLQIHTDRLATDDVAGLMGFFTSNPLQVCYELATPITINLTPHTINLLKGVNNISTDGDKITLTYRDGSVATLGDLTSAVDELDSKIDESKILTDTATGDKYILVVTNGVLSVQQVSN